MKSFHEYFMESIEPIRSGSFRFIKKKKPLIKPVPPIRPIDRYEPSKKEKPPTYQKPKNK